VARHGVNRAYFFRPHYHWAMSQAWRKAYELIVTEDEGRICRDIPESACAEQPGNFFKHALSLAATKPVPQAGPELAVDHAERAGLPDCRAAAFSARERSSGATVSTTASPAVARIRHELSAIDARRNRHREGEGA